MDLRGVFDATPEPLEVAHLWQACMGDAVHALLSRTLPQAMASAHSDAEAVARTVVGMHAHGFLFGREHARTGLLLPWMQQQDLRGVNPGDLIVPDDLSGM